MTDRHVRGTLFLDYVRMLRKARVDATQLHADDVRYVTTERIDPFEWYPMAVFERLGLTILRHIVGTETDAIRLWGRSRLEAIVQAWPALLVAGDPVASIHQFHGFFKDAFDFETVTLPRVEAESAQLCVAYGMSPEAERAAAWQTAGFFETVVTASGGRAVRSVLRELDFAVGSGPATFELKWERAAPDAPVESRPRVLVVDDEALVLAAMRRILRSVADVTTAIGPREAIALLEQQPFDGVLCDFNMPEHDGLWLLREVARRWPHTRRVLQSADMPPQAREAVALGIAHELLEKPAAVDVVRAAFDKTRSS